MRTLRLAHRPSRLLAAALLICAAATGATEVPAQAASPPAFVGQIYDPGGVAPLYPAGAAADAAGNVYVADSGGDRIVRIDAFGVQTVVSATGWDRPRDLAIDPVVTTHLWVTDTTDNQIVLVTTGGTILEVFGGPGYVRAPFGISVDASGVYVADTYNDRVFKIAKSDGTKLWIQTTCGGVRFSRPRDVAVGSDGKVYVADTSRNRIGVLDPSTGGCLRTFGSSGSGPGQFRSPRSLASDGSGGLWVAEAHNSRIQHVTNAGAFIAKTGSYGSGPGRFRAPACVYVGAALVGVCDTFEYVIQRFTIGGDGTPAYLDSLGGVRPVLGGFNEPFGVAFGPAGELFVTDMFNHRVQGRRTDLAWIEWGGFGTRPGSMQFPRGIAVSDDGSTVVLTNSENNRIDLFRPDGSLIRSVRPSGTSFGWPHQTALAPDGTYWVADTYRNRVLHLAADGTVLLSFDHGGLIKTPRGIALDSSGTVYVANSGANTVEKYDATGRFLGTIATPGSGATNVKLPWNLFIGGEWPNELLYIADGNNHRIVVLTLTGDPVFTFGSPGTGPGRFSSPRGVSVDPTDGTIAVADFGNDRIALWG